VAEEEPGATRIPKSKNFRQKYVDSLRTLSPEERTEQADHLLERYQKAKERLRLEKVKRLRGA
jgi:hypothetical protein